MEVKDQVYAFEIARRSVGRAALHLGITGMEESALDCLADILLQYLQRTGKTMSHLVESSGRSSSHCNILDTLQACQVAASPAVQRLHLAREEEEQLFGSATSNTGGAAAAVAAASDSTGNNSKTATTSNSTTAAISSFGQDSSTDWKGLAAFCFGPKWLEEKEESGVPPAGSDAAADMMELDSEEAAGASQQQNGETGEAISRQPGGGKQLAAGGGGTVGDEEEEDDAEGGLAGLAKKRKNKGWNAPYLEDVPEFPQASETCANPHALPAKTRLSLHYRKTDIDALEAEEEEEATQEQLDHMPDDVFAKGLAVANQIARTASGSWGGMKKRKLDDGTEDNTNEDADTSAAPPTKRVKLNDGKAAGTATDSGKTDSTAPRAHQGGDAESSIPSDFSYVPSFYPPPPSTKEVVDRGRTVVDLQAEQQKMLLQKDLYNPATSSSSVTADASLDDSQVVRSSLVNMGQFYWGSGWDGSASSVTAKRAAVPMGRPPPAAKPLEEPIDPVSKASGARVAKIIEGSMDAAAMQ